VPLPEIAGQFDHMYVTRTHSRRLLVEKAPFRNTHSIRRLILIADTCQWPNALFGIGQAVDSNRYVNNRFRPQTGHGGTANVLDGNDFMTN
jgi:hypothetical protein